MWLPVFLQSCLWFLLWVILGIISLVVAQPKRKESLAAIPLLPFFGFGVLSVISPLITWTPASVALGFFALLVIVYALRALGFRVRGKKPLRELKARTRLVFAWIKKVIRSRAFLLGLCATVINAISLTCAIALAAGSTETVIQSYDTPFHASVIRFMTESHVASPIGAGSVAGSPSAVYPSLWHALAALSLMLFGTSVQEGIWVIVLAFGAFILPVCLCVLAYALFGTRRVSVFFFAPLASCATPLGISILPLSYFNLLTYGPFYGLCAALALFPCALGWVILVFANKRLTADIPRKALCLIVCIVSLGLFHPSAVFLLAVFMLPLMVALTRRIWARAGLVIFFGACWMALFSSSFFSRTVYCLDRVPYSVEYGETLCGFLHLDYAGLELVGTFPLLVFALVVAIGILLAWLLRNKWANSWYIVGIAFVMGICACSFFPTNWFSIIASGFWYRDVHRLLVIATFVTCPALCAIPSLCARKVSRAISAKSGARATLFRCIMALFVLLALALCAFVNLQEQRNIRTRTHHTDLAKFEYATTPEQEAFSRKVADYVGNAVVFNSNANITSVWLYPLYGVNAVFKALPANNLNALTADEMQLVEHIDAYAEDSPLGQATREAVERLGVEYVVQLQGDYATTVEYLPDAQVAYTDYPAIGAIDEDIPGFELVLEQDDMRLFKLV